MHGTFKQHQHGFAEKRAHAGGAGQIARGELAGADQRQARQSESARKSDGPLAEVARIVPSVMELWQQDVGRDVHEADPTSGEEDAADPASQSVGIVLRYRGPVAAEEGCAAGGKRKKAAAEICNPCRPRGVAGIDQRKLAGH